MQKNKTIQQYENMCSKNETTIKKQETQIKSKQTIEVEYKMV